MKKKTLVSDLPIAKEWHPTKNTIRPNEVTFGSEKKVWWVCKKGHEWEAAIQPRIKKGVGCPYCSNKKIGYGNDLKSQHPDLSKEWDFSKNKFQPNEVFPGSHKKVWWKCLEGHEWEASIVNRTSHKRGCPYCSNNKVGYGNDLKSKDPILAKEWNYKKNKNLTPNDVVVFSNKKVWWECKKGHEWEAIIYSRSGPKKSGCPYCSGRKTGYGNDFKSQKPDLVKLWNFKKNTKIKPTEVSPFSHSKVWWICKKGHEWLASISHISNGKGCPFCSNKKIGYGNDLESQHPHLSKEWDFSKNKFQPNEVFPGSHKKVWWKCLEGHEWEASIVNRTSHKTGCPFCSNKKIGYGNDLKSLYPELSKEWNYSKNKIKPTEITSGSSKKVWWICVKGHQWKTSLNNRTRLGSNCPYCNIQSSSAELYIYAELSQIFDLVEHRKKINNNEVDIFVDDINLAIEYDGSYWHKNKIIKDKEKFQKIKDSGVIMINVREGNLKRISGNDIKVKTNIKNSELVKKLFDHIKDKTSLTKKQLSKINEYQKNNKQIGSKLYNKMLSYLPGPVDGINLKNTFPKISQEWNIKKNGELLPDLFSPHSGQKVWWKCKKNHEWEAVINSRTGKKKLGCPFCSNQKVGYGNDFMSEYPDLAKQWHPTKNGSKKPSEFTSGSNYKAWWECLEGHEWEASIVNRTSHKRGCPYCSGTKTGYGNDLKTLFPKVAKQWHPTKNGNLNPSDFRPGSIKKIWWKCEEGHSWLSEIRTGLKSKTSIKICPYCSNQKTGYGNDLATLKPDIANEWHPTKNGNQQPSEFTPGSGIKVWWQCKKGHEWETQIVNRGKKGTSCPICYKSNI